MDLTNPQFGDLTYTKGMSVKSKWKTFGKSVGKAFSNLGHSFATTAKAALGDEPRVDEEGHSTLKQSWGETGRSFGKAGSNLGHAASATAKKAVGEEDKEEDSIEVEVVDEKADPQDKE